MRAVVLSLAIVLAGGSAFAAAPGGMARVGPGSLRPLYAPDSGTTAIDVRAFELARVPVTNREFLAFVQSHPEWRRDRVAHVFADDGYLRHWVQPDELGAGVDPDQPVTQVSWFAAKAYCAAQGQRLPTEAEWELAAAAGDTSADGSTEAGIRERILAWYGRPAGARLDAVGHGTANYWGVYDLNTLVWEWVLDFNGTLVSGDSRSGASADRMQFCGAGALAAGDKQDYASFMRLAFRGSLEARYTTSSLGFRCARDVVGP
ncbi:MAG TPA: formylglycine-generating enzyme family protein [Candidatus Bathyarchaeia archaeon]|nr:formylglycine-generating enzyme family protein [Candidatus Bathyarchaeia archaeon]